MRPFQILGKEAHPLFGAPLHFGDFPQLLPAPAPLQPHVLRVRDQVDAHKGGQGVHPLPHESERVRRQERQLHPLQLLDLRGDRQIAPLLHPDRHQLLAHQHPSLRKTPERSSAQLQRQPEQDQGLQGRTKSGQDNEDADCGAAVVLNNGVPARNLRLVGRDEGQVLLPEVLPEHGRAHGHPGAPQRFD